jgi:hypothetical protein
VHFLEAQPKSQKQNPSKNSGDDDLGISTTPVSANLHRQKFHTPGPSILSIKEHTMFIMRKGLTLWIPSRGKRKKQDEEEETRNHFCCKVLRVDSHSALLRIVTLTVLDHVLAFINQYYAFISFSSSSEVRLCLSFSLSLSLSLIRAQTFIDCHTGKWGLIYLFSCFPA